MHLYAFTSALSLSLFVGRASVCAWLALRPCKALGHTHLRHPCLACSSRCTEPLHPHNPRKIATIPRKSPTSLPPLSKGGGLTARHKLLPCNVLLATHPPFLFTKLFCRQDGRIAPLHLIPIPSHLSFLFNILLATILKLTIDYIVVYHHFPPPFIFHHEAPPSAISPSFRYTSVPTISNPIYSHNIYLTLSQISRTALSVRSHPPPKPPIIFKFL